MSQSQLAQRFKGSAFAPEDCAMLPRLAACSTSTVHSRIPQSTIISLAFSNHDHHALSPPTACMVATLCLRHGFRIRLGITARFTDAHKHLHRTSTRSGTVQASCARQQIARPCACASAYGHIALASVRLNSSSSRSTAVHAHVFSLPSRATRSKRTCARCISLSRICQRTGSRCALLPNHLRCVADLSNGSFKH